jgi:iron(II)-dependent oxidoreductase
MVIPGNAADKSLKKFLKSAGKTASKPLNSYSDSWKPLPQQLVEMENTAATGGKMQNDGSEMIHIPAVKGYRFEGRGVMIEGNELPTAIGVQRPWQEHPSRDNYHDLDIPAFYIDKYPVTNEQFKQFIDATGYAPRDGHNFLRDWINGSYPPGWAKKPVTWVSLEDARAYAKWAGKRLPHEWEWQYAAQGKDKRLYPWGNEADSTRMPLPDTSRTMRPPTDVDAFPQGANEAGIMDLVGNVWQWTDEYRDEHTRSAILKGGSYFRAQTSFWYFPQAYELNKYAKYLLMAPGLDRAGTIGFRCVKDAETSSDN